jgi:putative SOS response-associated peptidase YedK
MCNLTTVRKSAAEVARHVGVRTPPDVAFNVPAWCSAKPTASASCSPWCGASLLRLKGMKPDSKPKPVNNIADLSKPMWSGLAKKPHGRCLIPLTGFAEPAGPKGSKTRTWVTVKGQPIFAWGGLWRESAEWGPVYSGAMADCNEAIRPLHDRMPVLLHPHEYEQWLRASFEDLLAFQKRCFPDDLIEIEPTSELWVKKKAPASSEAPSLL